jgi:hypothetical protein
MKITHASFQKIEKVEAHKSYENDYQRGCLFFASEGNTYNLANECNFQYNIEVENILDITRLNYEHDFTECKIMRDVFQKLREELGIDCDDEEISEILDETNSIYEYETTVRDFNAGWIVQQYQGILAHRLGYDCAESFDEQGAVYIAYCVGRELQEIAVK